MNEDASFFGKHGWIILKGILSVDEVAALTRAYDEVIGPSLHQVSNNTVVQIPQPHIRHSVFTQNLKHTKLWSSIRKTLGWNDIQLLQDVLLYRTGPSTGRVEWHRDHTYTAFLNPPILASVRISLTHSRPQTGCLQVIDKSHLLDLSISSDIFGTSIETGLISSLDEEQKKISSKTRAIELEPGDVSIHHSKTLHGSFENATDEAQKIIVHHIFDAACKLNPSKLPEDAASAYFPTTSTGHLAYSKFPILG